MVDPPTAATMEQYDVVVVYSTNDFHNAAMLGDNLATFADAGGAVVEFSFDWTNTNVNRRPEGRWATQNYSAFNVSTSLIGTFSNLGVRDTSSPYLSGVNSLRDQYRSDLTVAPGAIGLASWEDGKPAIAVKGHALGVNACVADGCESFTGDFARLIVNAGNVRGVGQLVAPTTMCGKATFLQPITGSGNPYTVPLSGIVTSWYFQTGTPTVTDLKLKVARDAGLPSYRIVGESPAGAQVANQINGPYPARFPVAANDTLGIFNGDSTGQCAKASATGFSYVFANATDVPPGTTTAFSTPTTGLQFPIEAFVEADADADGFGDLSQDGCPGISAATGGCLKADLAATKTASVADALVGQNVTYTLTAKNNGPDTAPGVVLTDTLPGGATFVTSGTPTAGSCTGTQTVTCSFGALASGATVTVTVVARMTSPGTQTDTATVRSAGLEEAARNATGAGDTNSANNSASATTRVTRLTAAVISGATQTHSRWREPRRPLLARFSRKRKRPPVGTTFGFTLDKAATVRLAFAQALPGRKVGAKCVRPTARNRKRHRCTRFLARGSLSHAGHAGRNAVRFQGRLSGTRKLKPGSYRVVITATTPGVGSTSKTLRFTIAS